MKDACWTLLRSFVIWTTRLPNESIENLERKCSNIKAQLERKTKKTHNVQETVENNSSSVVAVTALPFCFRSAPIHSGDATIVTM